MATLLLVLIIFEDYKMVISLEEINPFNVKTHKVAQKSEQITYCQSINYVISDDDFRTSKR